MQDAELFFQAADHRHLFLYIDGLAETEARRQTDVCNYARKRLDDYEALQKKVERLEQELQQEKDANALLQTQLAQQSREAAVHSSQKTTTEDKQAGTAPAQDNAEDWYRLGKQYACGEGVPQDDDRACQWYAKAAATFKKAAEQGDAAAQYRLGDMYKEAKGVPRDNDRACQWYAKAAAQGHEAGLSVLKQLAKQGYVAAQYCLGDMYNYGEGVPRNGDIACQWYAKAAAQGHYAGLSILKQLAAQGEAAAQYRLGDMYKEGKGVPRDGDIACQWYAKAAATFKEAAEQGDAEAQFCLGDMYKEGKGVPRDGAGARQWYTKAAATFTKAAEQGDAEAQFRLGDMYKKGIGVPRNGDIACQWYAKAAAQKHEASLSVLKILAQQEYVAAQYRLGEMYNYGEGVPRNDELARRWFEQAAARGHADAQYRLGCMYRKGEGVPRDDDLARRWLKKAIAQGHADALNDFGKMY